MLYCEIDREGWGRLTETYGKTGKMHNMFIECDDIRYTFIRNLWSSEAHRFFATEYSHLIVDVGNFGALKNIHNVKVTDEHKEQIFIRMIQF